MQRAALGMLTAMLLAACQPAERPLTEDERLALVDTVLMVHRDLVTAAREANADRVLSFFTDDVGLIINGEVVTYEALSQQLQRGYAVIARQRIQSHPAKVSVLSRDVVVLTLSGSYAAMNEAGDTIASGPSAWTEVLVRQDDGSWKVTDAHQSFPTSGGG